MFVCTQTCTPFPMCGRRVKPRVRICFKPQCRANPRTELGLNFTGVFPGNHSSPGLSCGGLSRTAWTLWMCEFVLWTAQTLLWNFSWRVAAVSVLYSHLISTIIYRMNNIYIYTFLKEEHWLGEDSDWILGAKGRILGSISFFLKLFEAVRWWNRARDVSQCDTLEKYLMWIMLPITSSILMCVGKGGLILSGIN